ncbi:hypothetical protein FIA58_006075 [Flavobacterium jejuense]|uniref:Uncharacterized protein n=1 Tax=Flavobacterium jejuense TaxID=1544455 RepID=A0ABX0IT12_9FLAO|nr:hypothetical protein [Flavobacterium jejuense]NHN25241.1 hypothetical protein [Flavobacterium jejuense]
MKAETAYNVIQALPQQEVERLYKMLGVVTATFTPVKKSKKKPLLSDAEATEYLLKKLGGI